MGTFDDWGGDEPIGPLSEVTQHPPLYYLLFTALLRVLRWLTPGTGSLAGELAVLRLANVALVMWLPLLVWRAAREFGLPDATAKIACIVPLAIPQLVHIGSTVNNDNLLIALCAVTLLLLARVLRGDRAPRTALLLGAIVGAAVLTKLLALVFLPAVGFAYWMSARSGKTDASRRLALRPLVIAVGTIGVVAGWWFVRNVAANGALAPTAAELRLTADLQPPGFDPDLLEYLKTFVPKFLRRFWGEFGWYSAGLPAPLSFVATGALVALLVVGIVVVLRPDGRTFDLGIARRLRRADVVVLLGPALALAALVFQHAWALHAESGRTPFIQGRYLFSAIAGVAIAAGVGLHRVAGRWSMLAAAGCVALMHFVALRAIFATYWFAPTRAEAVRAAFAWSPWPDWLLWLGCLLAIASLGWFARELRREAIARDYGRNDGVSPTSHNNPWTGSGNKVGIAG